MKYLIYGAGGRGKTILHILKSENVIAFIDSNVQKIGTKFCDKDVISYLEYKDKYRDYVIIVSPVMGDDIKKMLDDDEIFYFALDECPSEFMGYGWTRVEHKLPTFEQFCVEGEKIIIYGCTLFSIWLYDRLRRMISNDIIIVSQIGMKNNKLAHIKKYYREYPICEWNSIKINEYTKVLVTVYDKDIKREKNDDAWIDVFDWRNFYPEYDNLEIREFRNKHKGEKCFIVATGPSLRLEDLEKLKKKNIVTFSMNVIFELFDKTDWRPSYYAIVDALGIDMWKESIRNIECEHAFISDASIEFDYDDLPENMHIYHALSGAQIYNEMNFSRECSKYIYSIGTITYVCMQLAIYMGFENIYLLGVDYNYKPMPGNYVSNKKEIVMSQSFINISDYYVKKAYEKVLEISKQDGIHIYNATRGGKLDVFERVDFDEVIEL